MTTPDLASDPLAGRGPTRGWCPGVLDPMETGDGWLLRLRVPGGATTPDALEAVAAIAASFGSGIVDITSRANLQIRGIAADRLADATDAVTATGLVGEDAERDALRAVLASPLTGHDPQAATDSSPLLDTIVRRLADEVVGSVPSKFGIVIDDGGQWPLGGIDADLTLRAFGDGVHAVALRGASGEAGLTNSPVETVVAAVQLCVDHSRRMNDVIATLGLAVVAERLGLRVCADGPTTTATKDGRRILGSLDHHEPTRVNVVAAPFLGRGAADVLRSIAKLAVAYTADVRLTPDHSVAFCAVERTHAPALIRELHTLGLIVDANDPRASISACVGSAGCLWAHADTLAAANERAQANEARGRVHLSACAKQCGAPSGVPLLVADETGVFR